MNWKHKENGKIITDAVYNNLYYSERLSYQATYEDVTDDEDEEESGLVGIITAGMALGSLLGDDGPSTTTESIDMETTFGGFGDGNSGGGGAGGEW